MQPGLALRSPPGSEAPAAPNDLNAEEAASQASQSFVFVLFIF